VKEADAMEEKQREEAKLPLRSIHDFLFEIDSEWGSFRTGSLLSLVTTVLLFIVFLPRYFLVTLKQGGPLDKLVAVAIAGLLLYSAYTSWRQHKFYQRWEKRLGLLLHLERELLGE
jgi:hypothetical protein